MRMERRRLGTIRRWLWVGIEAESLRCDGSGGSACPITIVTLCVYGRQHFGIGRLGMEVSKRRAWGEMRLIERVCLCSYHRDLSVFGR